MTAKGEDNVDYEDIYSNSNLNKIGTVSSLSDLSPVK